MDVTNLYPLHSTTPPFTTVKISHLTIGTLFSKTARSRYVLTHSDMPSRHHPFIPKHAAFVNTQNVRMMYSTQTNHLSQTSAPPVTQVPTTLHAGEFLILSRIHTQALTQDKLRHSHNTQY